MKKSILFILFLIVTNVLFAQKDIQSQPKLSVELGYMIISDNLNHDQYLSRKYPNWFNHENNDSFGMRGVNLKLTLETKWKFIDLVCGTMFLNDRFTILSNMSDYKQNGGGVYLGISPKYKAKHFGLTSDFALGVLSFKKYMHTFYQIPNGGQLIDGHETKASQGLGAVSSVGFYVSAGKFSLNPSFMLIFSGGTNASFTYYGFNIPLVFKF